MKNLLVGFVLLASLGASAQRNVQKSMLDTFVKYASIDSQSPRGYADLQEMECAYRLMLEVIRSVATIK